MVRLRGLDAPYMLGISPNFPFWVVLSAASFDGAGESERSPGCRVRVGRGFSQRADEARTMAISEKKLRANRENAKKSTGPKTVEGKNISKRNALKHGLSG